MNEEHAERVRILIVDDEAVPHPITDWLESRGYLVDHCTQGAAAIEKITAARFDIMLLDLHVPGMDGLEVLRRTRAIDEGLCTIIMTGYGTLQSAIQGITMGADECLLKPLDLALLDLTILRALRQRRLRREESLLREQVAFLGRAKNMIAHSKSMIEVLALVAKVAPLPGAVLLEGESGTGKELVARAIHAGSRRAEEPFVAVNCAIPLSLLESELFGHERGSFTGAESRHVGSFEAIGRGTIFLDEISETPLDLQAKLFRVLQERSFYRVGGTEKITTDARVIVSTNRVLRGEVARGRFRQDLFHRLNAITIRVPPLRERPEDISGLAYLFVARFAREFGKAVTGIASDAMGALLRFSWPGNVRELENALERAVALAEGPLVERHDLAHVGFLPEAPPGAQRASNPPLTSYAAAREGFEKDYFTSVLKAARGNVSEAGRMAGIARQHVYQKLKKLGIENRFHDG